MVRNSLLALSLGLALMACGGFEHDRTDATGSATAQAGLSEVKISVPTVQCGSCQNKVEKALQAVAGVKTAKVDLDAKVARVSFDPQKVGLAELEKAIALAGYDANNVKRDSTAYAGLDPCCKLPEDR
ncbi:MAG: heavy-metal-associated domain-containing protein [candidate division KSB1 bacterium]|nr:heavy-metal-associated domain-containing protein [candidate division KSB1 bacterium]MDZ7272710.1 heavy-metal-associated domain-containing protein [candidate division KSB1 bacterium]MDZ7284267.1 heavy-metal-associated domain-containing protein [candidate division KSB1 bacterium]MDZ7297337.1 heavy-metal-associated domain-containing protein [candidate division KSB1 bacterium]MDZ7307046.1 heavy-metal-associated domain-containing protein [candidate division KSB1 bacterium]